MTQDEAFEIAQLIAADAARNLNNIESEEDSKIQIINRFLFEVLGWHQADTSAERKHESGFSDYIIADNGNPEWLLEAKRIGILGVATQEKNKVRELKISGSSLTGCRAGFQQAVGYALPEGISLAVLTDGLSWIVFKTFSPGKKYDELAAYVFPSLEAVLTDFSKFYELLAKESLRKKLYKSMFDGLHQNRLALTERLRAPFKHADIRLSQKNSLAFDLEKVFSEFFERLSGKEDSDLLSKCFVESRESRIADFSLEKMTASVLGNINVDDKDVAVELSDLIEVAVGVDNGQTIFIVGPTGAGKTTFLERFFNHTLSAKLRSRCVVSRVNFLDSTGNTDNILGWMTEVIITSMESTLFGDGYPSYDELRGMYFSEYQRQSKGVHAVLYEGNRTKFREKFGEFMNEQVENDRDGYLKRLLENVVVSRKQLPILLFDNTDEFPMEVKEKIFQYSQSLRRNTNHCMLIFPLTDKSAWAFSKTDIYGIYKSRSFYLPTPSPREVFRKRIDFLKSRLDQETAPNKRADYFNAKGIQISIQDLGKFAKVLENVFVDQDYTSKTIGGLSNYNIRRTLDLSKRVITSSVFNIESLIKSYVTETKIETNYYEFMNALLKGDYELYRSVDANHIYPIFHVDLQIRQSPLLKLRILTLLDSVHKHESDIVERHLSVQSITSYFDSCGCPEASVEKALLSLLEAGLIEPFDVSVVELAIDQKFAISHSGKAHLRLATSSTVYFEQMALTTPIVDEDLAMRIADVYSGSQQKFEKLNTVRSMFLEYLLAQDSQQVVIPAINGQYSSQRELTDQLKTKILAKDGETDMHDSLEYREGVVHTKIAGTIDWIDADKGFGFVDIDGGERAFLHLSNVGDEMAGEIGGGDSVICDVSREVKGLSVSRIHRIIDATIVGICKVIRLHEHRGYGFVDVEGVGDAFFHYSIFGQAEQEDLTIGHKFHAEVGRSAKGLQEKKLLALN